MMRSMPVLLRRLAPFSVLAVLVALWVIPRLGDAELAKEPADGAAKVLGYDIVRDTRTTPKAKDDARKLASKMVCLCGDCPRYNLGECACGWADKGRHTIELALLDGKGEEEILAAFVKAYDFKVLDALPNEGFGRVSYLVPYAAAIFGLLGVVFIGIRLKRKAASHAPASPKQPEQSADQPKTDAAKILERELDDLD